MGLVGNPAHQEAVGRLLLRDDRQGGLVKVSHQLGGFPGLGILGVHGRRGGNGETLAVRIGISQRPLQAFAAEDHHEAVALAGLDDDLGIAHFLHLLRKQGAELFADPRVNPPGAPVGDDAFGVERAEIGACRHIARAQFEAQPERLDDAAADLELQRVIAKQAQVARPAPRGDARRNGNHAPLRGILRQRIHVRGGCGFERGEVALFARGHIAHAIKDDQRQLGTGFQSQFSIKSIQVHNSVLLIR